MPSFEPPPRNEGLAVPPTPGGGGRPDLKKKRPSLIIPPPQSPGIGLGSPYTANIAMGLPTGPAMTASPHHNPYLYPRKASQFMFSQFNGLRDFTMSTAKSGLGIGEKCSFWLYNKVSTWSKKWFTHMFLTIVILFYTVGGALLFVYIEGKQLEELSVTHLNKKCFNFHSVAV